MDFFHYYLDKDANDNDKSFKGTNKEEQDFFLKYLNEKSELLNEEERALFNKQRKKKPDYNRKKVENNIVEQKKKPEANNTSGPSPKKKDPNNYNNQGDLIRSTLTGKRFHSLPEDHDILAHHVEPGKRDYDISEIQLRTMFNNREYNDISEDFTKIITDNLDIRNLSDIARDYGFYSTFIVGDKDTYFVFGCDNEYINTTEFVEHNGRLFPLDFVRLNGYSLDERFLSFKWISINITKRISDGLVLDLEAAMAALEFLKKMYEVYHLGLPEFIMFDTEIALYINSCDMVVTDVNTKGTVKKHFENVAISTLEDIAVWGLPAKESCDIGYLAWVIGTRYNAFAGIDSKARNIYKDFRNWNKHLLNFEDKNPKTFYDATFNTEETDYLVKEMQRRGAPCRVVETQSEISKKEREVALSIIYNNEMARQKKADKSITLRYSAADHGLLEYLDEEYTELVLSKECMDYGDELIAELDREDTEPMTSHTGVCVIFVNHMNYKDFVKNCMMFHINVGHPRAWKFRWPYTSGIFFVTPYYNLARLKPGNNGSFYTPHLLTSMKNSAGEQRMRTPTYNGKIWLTEETKGSGNHSPLPTANYTDYLIERGMLVSNDGMDIPVPDELSKKEQT